jgi:hypothetical protein
LGFKKLIRQVKATIGDRGKAAELCPFYIINYFRINMKILATLIIKIWEKQAQAESEEVTIQSG